MPARTDEEIESALADVMGASPDCKSLVVIEERLCAQSTMYGMAIALRWVIGQRDESPGQTLREGLRYTTKGG